MTDARRLAAILAADVGVREHRDGASENTPTAAYPLSKHAWSSAAISLRPTRTNPARSSA